VAGPLLRKQLIAARGALPAALVVYVVCRSAPALLAGVVAAGRRGFCCTRWAAPSARF